MRTNYLCAPGIMAIQNMCYMWECTIREPRLPVTDVFTYGQSALYSSTD